MFNKTFNDHWGLEIFAPARGLARYNLNRRCIFTAGWDLEGASYRIQPIATDGILAQEPDLELRKSELRFRLSWEQQTVGFWWFTLTGGYRYNFAFDLVESDHVSGRNILLEGDLSNNFFVNAGFHLALP
jgi:hypothetical protein